MQQLRHCYVVRYLESFVKGKTVCIVMEYAERGDLEKYLESRRAEGKPLGEAQVLEWFIQLALGLKYIHDKKILHRDLKADNIFLTANGQIKIGDFGISKLMSETFDLAKTKIGTPFVMAPEIWEDRKYNQKSDVWSLGCVLHKMLTLRYPFEA